VATVSSSRRRSPARRPRQRYKPIILLVALLLTWAVMARRFAPTANTSRDHFDAILVLGTPADEDGNPTPEQLARVTEGVREYERGIAPRLIFSGGPAHNRFVEAEVMAGAAAAQGIPPSAISIETKAKDTIENACYSERLMKMHGWNSVEVVSSGDHLPRAGLIFGHTPLEWRMHAAPGFEPGDSGVALLETLKTMRYLVYARWAERCEP
jgi:uncharacterized SAM-binding protein YcdF (DUF218 family)